MTFDLTSIDNVDKLECNVLENYERYINNTIVVSFIIHRELLEKYDHHVLYIEDIMTYMGIRVIIDRRRVV
ncbi:MAG: hypothetical protein ACFFG0_02695 [Candidatus Thorarchaeota archaeon]